jgi:hypothetical protein
MLGVYARPICAQVTEFPPLSPSEKATIERLKRANQARETQTQKSPRDERPTGQVGPVPGSTSQPSKTTIVPQQGSRSTDTETSPSGKIIMIPKNAQLDYTGHGWTCSRGYQQVRNECVRVTMPPNAQLDYTGHGWTCSRGYQQVRDECVPLLQAR